MEALCQSPPFVIGGWVWAYNSVATIRQGTKKGTYTAVLKTNSLSTGNVRSKLLRWTCRRPPPPSMAVLFTTSSSTPTSPLTRRDGRGFNRRVSVVRCKFCRNPDDIHDMPEYVPANATKHMFDPTLPSFPRTTSPSTTPHRHRHTLRGRPITGHCLVQSRGGVIARNDTHWAGLIRPF